MNRLIAAWKIRYTYVRTYFSEHNISNKGWQAELPDYHTNMQVSVPSPWLLRWRLKRFGLWQSHQDHQSIKHKWNNQSYQFRLGNRWWRLNGLVFWNRWWCWNRKHIPNIAALRQTTKLFDEKYDSIASRETNIAEVPGWICMCADVLNWLYNISYNEWSGSDQMV